MLHMALVFLVIGLIAALLGFTTIAGASIAIAKFLAGLFLILFLVFLVIAMVAATLMTSRMRGSSNFFRLAMATAEPIVPTVPCGCTETRIFEAMPTRAQVS